MPFVFYTFDVMIKYNKSAFIIALSLILGLASCVLKHDDQAPAMTFRVGPAYTLDSAVVDTSSSVLVGFSAHKNSANMIYLQVAKAIDTAAPVLLNSYVLADSNQSAINRDFSFRTGVYQTNKSETYIFKISDDAGFTFQKSIAFTVHPH
jgi:hypothetical protein